MVALLRRNGLLATSHTARKLTKNEKIELLKSLLWKNIPVILLIGNGYHHTGEYDKKKARFTYHWISLWGYTHETNEFYLYDSAVPKTLYDKDISIGNKKRTYETVIRDWGACIVPWFWKNYYIKVSNNN